MVLEVVQDLLEIDTLLPYLHQGVNAADFLQPHALGEIFHPDLIGFDENHQTFDDIFQFPDIAGPLIVKEDIEGVAS